MSTRSGLISGKRLFGGFRTLIGRRKLGQITIVVTLHLVVEDLGLTGTGILDEMIVENLEDIAANLAEFFLNLGLVATNHINMLGIALAFFLLFDGRDDTPRCATSTDNILVGDRQQIALFNRQFLVQSRHLLHVLDHF